MRNSVGFILRILCVALPCMPGTGLYAEPAHYTIEQVGLTAPGYLSSSPSLLNEQGQVAGLSMFRIGGSTDLGSDAWLHSGGSSVKIGLTGPQYTAGGTSSYPIGTHNTQLRFLNNVGQVAGRSQYFLENAGAGPGNGFDAWIYNGSTTLQLGFTGLGYESGNGSRVSEVLGLNDLGQAAGQSTRMVVPDEWGQDAWLYQGGNTVQLGLTGVGYERANGVRNSYIGQLNNQGQVTGSSDRYYVSYGTTYEKGTEAWLYSGGNTVKIGLGTAQGIGDDNGRDVPTFLNEQGQVAGYHSFYSGGPGRAWLYDGSSTVQIGLTGVGYQDLWGRGSSTVSALTDQGQVLGQSNRFDDAGSSIGSDTWLYSAGDTVRIGLTGPEYEGTSSRQVHSLAHKINDQGHVVGGTDENSWFFDGTSTIKTGLAGAGYERANGSSVSTGSFLNNQDQMAGFSKRFRGDEQGSGWYPELGQDAWLFDANLNQTFAITASVRPSDNYAWSNVLALNEDGLVLGEYFLYDQATSAFLGHRLFSFTVDDGLHDLGLLVDDLTLDGWLSLNYLRTSNRIGNIIGNGTRSDGSNQTAYLLTPVAPVPIPAAAWLFGGALASLCVAMRRSPARKGALTQRSVETR